MRSQYVRRILDNITSNILKYADPAAPVAVDFVTEDGYVGLAFANAVLTDQRAESTKVGLTSIETMMDKMHGRADISTTPERFCITLLFTKQ